MIYKFMTPTLMEYGSGVTDKIGYYLDMYKCKKAMLICDKGIVNVGLADIIVKKIKTSGHNVVIWSEIVANPPVESVRDATAFAKKENINIIVALGGGSAIDTARAVSMALVLPMDIVEYLDFATEIDRKGVPIIAIPTTSGTGSEVSTGAIITEPEKKKKSLLLSTFAAAKVALIDADMSKSMPPHITAATGVDALTHCLEAFTTTLANPLSDAIAIKAAEMIVKYLPIACENGDNTEAREMMALAASMGAMAFNSAELHVFHAIAHPITAYWDIPHGIACAYALAYGLLSQASAIPEKLVKIAEIFEVEDIKGQNLAKNVEDAILKFCSNINIPRLSEFSKVKEEDFDLVANAIVSDAKDVVDFMHVIPKKEFYIELLKKSY